MLETFLATLSPMLMLFLCILVGFALKKYKLLPDDAGKVMISQKTAELMETIRFVRDNFDMTILLIEHDMKFVQGLCDEITVLNFGTVLAEGDTKTALSNPEVIKAYIGG